MHEKFFYRMRTYWFLDENIEHFYFLSIYHSKFLIYVTNVNFLLIFLSSFLDHIKSRTNHFDSIINYMFWIRYFRCKLCKKIVFLKIIEFRTISHQWKGPWYESSWSEWYICSLDFTFFRIIFLCFFFSEKKVPIHFLLYPIVKIQSIFKC